MLESEIGGEDNLVRCITCFQSGLDAVRASNEHFVGVVVLWKQMIRCTSRLRRVPVINLWGRRRSRYWWRSRSCQLLRASDQGAG